MPKSNKTKSKNFSKILNAVNKLKFTNRRRRRGFNNNLVKKVKYNFNSKIQKFGPVKTTVNISNSGYQNMTGDLTYLPLNTLIKNSPEWLNYSKTFSLFKIQLITVAIFPNDSLDNRPTYIAMDWFSEVNDVPMLTSNDRTKIVYNDSKKVKFFNWKPINYNFTTGVNDVVNLSIFNNVDSFIPGLLYFYQLNGYIQLRIDVRVVFIHPKAKIVQELKLKNNNEKKDDFDFKQNLKINKKIDKINNVKKITAEIDSIIKEQKKIDDQKDLQKKININKNKLIDNINSKKNLIQLKNKNKNNNKNNEKEGSEKPSDTSLNNSHLSSISNRQLKKINYEIKHKILDKIDKNAINKCKKNCIKKGCLLDEAYIDSEALKNKLNFQSKQEATEFLKQFENKTVEIDVPVAIIQTDIRKLFLNLQVGNTVLGYFKELQKMGYKIIDKNLKLDDFAGKEEEVYNQIYHSIKIVTATRALKNKKVPEKLDELENQQEEEIFKEDQKDESDVDSEELRQQELQQRNFVFF